MQEPSVLDFVKSRTRYWWRRMLHPSAEVQEDVTGTDFWIADTADTVAVQPVPGQAESAFRFPWPVLLVLTLAFMAQISFEPRQGADHTWQLGLILYLVAGLALILTRSRHEWSLQPWAEDIPAGSQDTTFLRSPMAFIIALVLSLVAFISFRGSQFTIFNVTVWLLAILAMIRAFWQPLVSPAMRLRSFLSRPQWNVAFSRSTLVALAVIGVILFFRFYRLQDVPSQMISDHAEKLLDVGDVLNGKLYTFFKRNTGREFFQFYWTAGIILLFKTGLTHLSLKIGTVLAGLIALLYIYLLGREIGSPRIGMLAVAFAGIAYWHNVISRFGLRFPIYPLFYAPALYYLVWGIQKRNRLGFILSGLFLGLGLHGYSPFRVVPFVILVAVGLYLLHKQSEGYRQQTVWGLVMLIIVSFIVFLPLLMYMIEDPSIVMYRAMTRLGDLERPLPGPAWQIFLYNLRNSLTMFAWDNGEIWPISIPHRPALDVVTSVFFHAGVVLMVLRYIRQRHWLDLFTLVSIPLLMMPSILSLSFPAENPSFNRSAAAIIPVFLIVGLAVDGFLTALASASGSLWNKRFAWAIGIFLFTWAALQNYQLVFNRYAKNYELSSWNTSEMGHLVRNFADLTGSEDTAWLVGYPHWADSRLVMMNAGFPGQDNAIWPQNFPETLTDSRPKLFLMNINDVQSKEALQSLYPNGWLTEYKSKYENKDFLLFFAPAQ